MMRYDKRLETVVRHLSCLLAGFLAGIAPLSSQEDSVTVNFFGDVMMHSLQIEKASRSDGTYSFDTYFTNIREYISAADLNVANLEFTLAGPPYTGYPSFSAPDQIAYHLAESGFNVFLTANNHICDKGSDGMARTLEIYRRLSQEKGIYFTGAASSPQEQELTTPLIVECKGIRIAFVNATYGTNLGTSDAWPKVNRLSNRKLIEETLHKASQEADIVMATIHWGEEYILEHSQQQEDTARWLAENGADVIIGSHPHVVQDYDILEVAGRKVPTVYSLGNLISNMSARDTQAGLIASLSLKRSDEGNVEIGPIHFTYLWCSRPGGYLKDDFCLFTAYQMMQKGSEGWYGKWEFEKMKSTIERVSQATRIKYQSDNE